MVFPWPIFVILGTGGYLSRLIFGKESAIEEEREKLRKKQARELTVEQGGSPDDTNAIEERRPDRDHGS